MATPQEDPFAPIERLSTVARMVLYEWLAVPFTLAELLESKPQAVQTHVLAELAAQDFLQHFPECQQRYNAMCKHGAKEQSL